MSGALPPFPNMPSWRGVQLKHRDSITFTFTFAVVVVVVVVVVVMWWGYHMGNVHFEDQEGDVSISLT
jgi:nitrogen fixation-related uncharacterized protein